MKKIGITLEQFSDIRSNLRKRFKNNHSINCGDFEEVYTATINETIKRIIINDSHKKYTREQILQIANNMVRFGGGFISCIGEALYKADQTNLEKLLTTFSEECETYLNMGE